MQLACLSWLPQTTSCNHFASIRVLCLLFIVQKCFAALNLQPRLSLFTLLVSVRVREKSPFLHLAGKEGILLRGARSLYIDFCLFISYVCFNISSPADVMPFSAPSVCDSRPPSSFRPRFLKVTGRSKACSLAKHTLHDYIVRHLVAVDEEIVLELLAQAEEAQLAHVCVLLSRFLGADLRQVVRLDHLYRPQVRYHDDLVAQRWTAHLDLNTLKTVRLRNSVVSYSKSNCRRDVLTLICFSLGAFFDFIASIAASIS